MMGLTAVKETGKYEFTEIKDMDYIRDRKVIFHLAYMIAGYYRLKLTKINYP